MSDEQAGYPGAPPGWYPDPAGGPGQRWWDGYNWSEATVAPSPPPPPWAAASDRMASASLTASVHNELSMSRLARLTLAYPGVSAVIFLIFLRVNAVQLRELGHQFHRSFSAAQNGLPAPTLTIPTFNTALGPIFSINSLLAILAVILTLVWQHRAATAGRALGLPAHHSPGWGVGSWFVPVINFWFPYQAIRDCLPLEDPTRPLVLRYWLCGIATQLTLPAAFFSSMFSVGVALALSIPAAVFAVGVIATAPRVVTSIATSHRSLLSTSGVTPAGR